MTPTEPRRFALSLAMACAVLAAGSGAAAQAPDPADVAIWDAAGVPADVRGRDDALIYDETDWNGARIVFVSYPTATGAQLTGLQIREDGGFDRFQVATVEEEGGAPVIDSITRVNADTDPGKELAVIVYWEQRHYDVSGRLYAVMIYDDLDHAKDGALTDLQAVSDKLDSGCECDRREGRDTKARYKTGDDVKKALARMGFPQTPKPAKPAKADPPAAEPALADEELSEHGTITQVKAAGGLTYTFTVQLFQAGQAPYDLTADTAKADLGGKAPAAFKGRNVKLHYMPYGDGATVDADGARAPGVLTWMRAY